MSLRVERLSAGYGDTPVLRDVSFEVRPGDVVALLGANGAGKTTTLNAISGLLVTRMGGRTLLEGRDISDMPPHARVGLGIAHVPQGRQLFPFMSVRENLEMGAYAPRGRAGMRDALDRVTGIFRVLRDRMSQMAGSLSGGEQQMCAIARGLMSSPRYLLLDEPSLGLAPIAVRQVMSVVAEISAGGIGVLLVEQNAVQALKLARYAYVLEQSRIVLEGRPDDLLEDDRVRRAYLGM